ncbi:uncharacterized protein LOC34622566 [Cyclospora cayetanensis]|nr:uncharacterized protein LOC34622566 [Cyclospora cayetanensis]
MRASSGWFFRWLALCVCCFAASSAAFSLRNPPSLPPGAAAFANPAPDRVTPPAGGPLSAQVPSSAPLSSASAAAAIPPSAAAEVPYTGAQSVSSLTQSVALPVFTAEQIKQILPHRFPFLLVDKVLQFEAGKRAVGVKQVSNNEDPFNGHFPERAVMPGVLQVEALAQLAGIVALQPPLSDGKGLFFFAGANGIKWKKPVLPGDTLVMEAELLTWKEKFGIAKFAGRGFVDGQLAVEVAEMTFAFGK